MRIPRRKPMLATAALLALSCLALAACGGSGSNTATAATAKVASATTTSSSAPDPPGGTTGGAGFSARFAALRACLKKQGITLPAGTGFAGRGASGRGGFAGRGATGRGGFAGRGATGRGGFFGGGATGPGGPGGRGLRLPKGVSAQKYQAAIAKCGGVGGFGAGRTTNTTQYRAALTKFAACMRSNGVKLPAPNTSGTGAVFNTKGLNTSSASFKSADAKCQSDLPAAFAGGGGRGGAPPTTAG
jgi:hypothetical protein